MQSTRPAPCAWPVNCCRSGFTSGGNQQRAAQHARSRSSDGSAPAGRRPSGARHPAWRIPAAGRSRSSGERFAECRCTGAARPRPPRPRQAVLRALRLPGVTAASDDADAALEQRQGLIQPAANGVLGFCGEQRCHGVTIRLSPDVVAAKSEPPTGQPLNQQPPGRQAVRSGAVRSPCRESCVRFMAWAGTKCWAAMMPHDTARDKEKAPLPMKVGAFEVPCDGVALNFGGSYEYESASVACRKPSASPELKPLPEPGDQRQQACDLGLHPRRDARSPLAVGWETAPRAPACHPCFPRSDAG